MTSAVHSSNDQLLLAYAELAALTVLEQAGRGLMRLRSRAYRGHKHGMDQIAIWQRHTVLPTDDVDLDKLLAGAFNLMDQVPTGYQDCVRAAIGTYVRSIIATAKPFAREDLNKVLLEAGCLTVAA